jgi:tetratricopeptide (TPR) repeat protein
MMRKTACVAAAAGIFLLCSGFDFFGLFAPQDTGGETAEHIFNTANEAMIKGNDSDAILKYYSLIEHHPEFKEYRADALYRLGTLLYKNERYEEAERALGEIADRHKDYQEIQKVYERLLYIYVQAVPDKNKAKKIREIYEKKFGKSEVLENMDKTVQILDSAGPGQSEALKLKPADIGAINLERSDAYDREFFPVICSLRKTADSPDMKLAVHREKNSGGKYYLYLGGAGAKNAPKIGGSRNGYAPQWAWDDSFIVFTAMNWGTQERNILLYDIKKRKIRHLFGARELGPLICVSPDGSLIAFWYSNGLWLVNKSGNSLTLISKKIKADDVCMMAWSRDGDKILAGRKQGGRDIYDICTLGRKEFVIVK